MGIIGLGRIGQQTTKYAIGLGMEVIATDAFIKTITIDLGIHGTVCEVTLNCTDLETVLKESDFISLHVPAQSGGKPVIGKSEIDKTKSGVILINLARGGVIDEVALKEALKSGKVRGAAIDVFVNEPTPDPALLVETNTSLSRNIGAATEEAQDRIGAELAAHIMSQFPLS